LSDTENNTDETKETQEREEMMAARGSLAAELADASHKIGNIRLVHLRRDEFGMVYDLLDMMLRLRESLNTSTPEFKPRETPKPKIDQI
jgi:hypothetical protein